MTQTEAKSTLLPFGKYQGQSIGRVGRTDDGLEYLSWMDTLEITSPKFREALTLFMNLGQTKKRLALIKKKETG